MKPIKPMKNILPLLVAVFASVSFGWAADLTPEQALNRLQNSRQLKAKSVQNPILRDGAQSFKHESTIGNLYVFSKGEGFVVLPDDDAAPALLAYSDFGSFDTDANPALAYWMEYYNSELQYLKSKGVTASQSRVATHKNRAEIKPLIQTEWNQEGPYNELCPKVDGKETVTGCVATAMAQAMKFYNYPAHGKGSHSYFWRPGEEELTFDYENTPFQWNLMTDRYDSKSSEDSKHAVAQLMLACGVSVDMHYEPGESGAATTVMGESLINIFDYSPSLWMPNRVFYGYDEWEEMIYADLAQGLPVLYSGAGTAGGHQFICDGYSSDGYFHFNWGWGGLSNGYFLLTALNPDDLGVGGGAGGFNLSQVATLGMRLPQTGDKPVYIMYNVEAFQTDAKTVKAGEDFSCKGLYYNYSLSTMPKDSRLGLKFTSADGKEVKYMDGPSVDGYRPEYGRENIQVRFPELPDGTYYITPALYADGKWLDVRMPVGYPSRVVAVVQDKIAELKNETGAVVNVEEIKLPSVIYRDREFPMPFNVRNTSTDEFYGTVTPTLLDSVGTVVAKSKFRPVDILGEERQEIADYIGDFTAEKDQEFPAGNYTLVFRDNTGKDVSAPITVKVEIMTEDTKISVSDFKVEGTEPVKTPESVNFAFKVDCESGAYFGSLQLFIFPGDGGRDVYSKSSDREYLLSGESKEFVITADLTSLKDGEYLAGIYEGDNMLSKLIRFRIERESSSVSEISGEPTQEIIYNLNGMPVKSITTPGIYIINGSKVYVR